jgi:hypothetical protein
MRLCCAIAIEGLARALSLVDDFVQTAEQCEPQDVWPTELGKWIKAQSVSLSDSERARLSQLAMRLDRAGNFGHWFSSLA